MISSKPRISPKTQEIFQSLKQVALDLGPQAKLPTVSQMRRDYGVSIATLDNVLTRLESQNVITRRQGSGIYVSPYLHKKTVGLVCAPEYFLAETSPFWSELIDNMRQRATLEGETFRFYLGLPAGRSQSAVHEDLQEDMAQGRLDGVFFIGNNPNALQWLEAQDLAVVNFAGRGRNKVSIDYRDLVEQGIERLRVSGCRRIALMSPFHYGDEVVRLKRSNIAVAFEEIVRAKGRAFAPELVWDAINIEGVDGQTYREQGFDAAAQMFGSLSVEPPDGVVILDDMLTRGALAQLQKLGVVAGRDVQIVSHSNRGSNVLREYEDDLTLLEVDPAEIVRAMFEMLNALMDGQELANSALEIRAHLREAALQN